MCTETGGKRERFEEFNYLTEACYWYALGSPCQRRPGLRWEEAGGVPGHPVGHWGPQLSQAETPALGMGTGRVGVCRSWWPGEGGQRGQREGSAGVWLGTPEGSFSPRLGWRCPTREVQMDSAGARRPVKSPFAGRNCWWLNTAWGLILLGWEPRCRAADPALVMPEFNVTRVRTRPHGGGCIFKIDLSQSHCPQHCPCGLATVTSAWHRGQRAPAARPRCLCCFPLCGQAGGSDRSIPPFSGPGGDGDFQLHPTPQPALPPPHWPPPKPWGCATSLAADARG